MPRNISIDVVINFHRSGAAELKARISNLRQSVDATTCIYYNDNSERNIDLSEIWQQCSAQVVLTKQPNMPFFEHFHSKILNIDFVNAMLIKVQFDTAVRSSISQRKLATMLQRPQRKHFSTGAGEMATLMCF